MALPSCNCVAGLYPNWRKLGPIVAAARTWAGEAPNLHCYDNRPIQDQLNALYCAIVTVSGGGGGGGGATLLASFYIPEIVDSFERGMAAGYTGNGDPETFQREAAVDVLRDTHYQSGISGQLVILEDEPTECVLAAPENVVGAGGELEFDASWDDIPVTVSLLRYEWRLDSTGSWNDNGTSTSITGETTTAGDHILNVRAVSTSGVLGETGNSASFTVDPSSAVWMYSAEVADLDSNNLAQDETPQYQLFNLPAGTIEALSVYTSQAVLPSNVKIAIYDSSKALITSGSLVAPSDGLAHDLEASIAPTVISAGDYYIGYQCDVSSANNFLLDTGVGTILFKFSVTYASFPNTPIAEDGSAALTARVGVLFS